MPSTISAGTTAGTAIAVAGDTTGNLAFQTNGTTTAMTIDTSQNVGIGTTSPLQKLDVRGTVIAGNGTIQPSMSISSRAEIGALSNHNLGLIANGSTQALLTTTGDFQFNSGYGGFATAYGCRAWVNFNGTGTVAIRANGNVSSITDNGTGDYTINFTNAMPDANYCAVVSGNGPFIDSYARIVSVPHGTTPTSSSIRVKVSNAGEILQDLLYAYVAIFR
jgi:hypothetical protein